MVEIVLSEGPAARGGGRRTVLDPEINSVGKVMVHTCVESLLVHLSESTKWERGELDLVSSIISRLSTYLILQHDHHPNSTLDVLE